MKKPTTSLIGTNLLEFMMLYHRKFAIFFHKQSLSQEFPLNKNQKRVLLILKHHRGITPTFLSQKLDLQKGSLTTLIDSLEEMALVKRETDSKDRRRVHLFLTEKGELAIGAILNEYRHYLEQLLSTLSDTELEQFQKNLDATITILKKIGG